MGVRQRAGLELEHSRRGSFEVVEPDADAGESLGGLDSLFSSLSSFFSESTRREAQREKEERGAAQQRAEKAICCRRSLLFPQRRLPSVTSQIRVAACARPPPSS